MKCIKATKNNNVYKVGHITRVENKDADLKVSTGDWMFIPKSEWKQKVRETQPVTSTDEEPKKKKKTKKQD
jgi:hypothetical protein